MKQTTLVPHSLYVKLFMSNFQKTVRIMETPTLPTNWLAPLSNANHVRKQKIGQNSLTSLRPHPRQPIFGHVGGFFVGLSVTLWLKTYKKQ